MFKITCAKTIRILTTFLLICSGISEALGADTDKPADSKEGLSNTSLQDYVNMDYHSQLDLILGAKNKVIEDVRYNDPDRAMCVARLFDTTEEGNSQFSSIKNILNKAAERNLPVTAEDIAEQVLTKKFCPEGSYSDDGVYIPITTRSSIQQKHHFMDMLVGQLADSRVIVAYQSKPFS